MPLPVGTLSREVISLLDSMSWTNLTCCLVDPAEEGVEVIDPSVRCHVWLLLDSTSTMHNSFRSLGRCAAAYRPIRQIGLSASVLQGGGISLCWHVKPPISHTVHTARFCCPHRGTAVLLITTPVAAVAVCNSPWYSHIDRCNSEH